MVLQGRPTDSENYFKQFIKVIKSFQTGSRIDKTYEKLKIPQC